MTFRTCSRFFLILTSFAAAACGVDRATAPLVDDASLKPATVGGAPSGLSAWAPSDVEIQLSWTDNSPNESGFEVHRSTSGINGTYESRGSTAAGVETFTDVKLTALTEYCYKVRTVRLRGGKPAYSSFTGPACATTQGPRPAPPTIDTRPQGSQILLTWGGSPTATSYNVFRSTSSGELIELVARSDGPSGGTYTIWWVPVETEVCYRAIAYNQWGETRGATDCTAVPATPSELTATTNLTIGGIDLVWKDNSSFEDGYEIHRSGSDRVFTLLATVPAGSSSHRDPVTAEGRYLYRVRAVKDGGVTSFTNDASALISSTTPNAPSEAAVVTAGSSAITVYWIDNSDNESSFEIERSTDRLSWVVAGSADWNAVSFTDFGRTPEQEVCYRVRAVGAGKSAPSNEACTIPLAAPSGLQAAPGNFGEIVLTWADNSSQEDGFEIRRYYCYGYYGYYGYGYCDYYTVGDVPSGTLSFTDTGLNYWEQYSYIVVAYKDRGGSREYSDWSHAYAMPGQP